jgi:hypothetical protein
MLVVTGATAHADGAALADEQSGVKGVSLAAFSEKLLLV